MLHEHTHALEQASNMTRILCELRFIAKLEMTLASELDRDDFLYPAWPRDITTTRLERKTASLIEWVMKTTVLPSSRDR